MALPKVLSLCALAALSIPAAGLYVRFRRRRWNAVLDAAVDYHVFHLSAISTQEGVPESSKDVARQMLQILRMQFSVERRGYRGLRDLLKWRMAGFFSMDSLGRVFYKIYRDRAFGIDGAYDERLYRLMDTLMSALARFFTANSALALPALLHMDAVLLATRAGLSRRGAHRLYADIAASMAEETRSRTRK